MSSVATRQPVLADLLTGILGNGTGVVIGHRLIEQEEVHRERFKNASMIIQRIPELFRDLMVAELCVCANDNNAPRLGETIMAAAHATKRKFRKTIDTLPDGKVWTFVFPEED